MGINLIIWITIFFLGASFGSFLSVVIHRISKGNKGIFFGSSKCPNCKKRLGLPDLIPLFSYIFLKGKCRHCKKPISKQYLHLELLTGLVFLALFFKFPFLVGTQIDYALLPSFIFYIIYSLFFIGIFFYDLTHKAIPDIFLFPLIGTAVIGGLITGFPTPVSMLIAVAIALVIFGGQILFSKGKWLGEGDLYLSIGLALIFGWQLFLTMVILSYIIGALVSVLLLATKQVKTKTAIPFAPFLILGSFLTIFFGSDILAWYMGTITI